MDQSRRWIREDRSIILNNHWGILKAHIRYPKRKRPLSRVRSIIGSKIIQVIHLRIRQITIVDNDRTYRWNLLSTTDCIFWDKEPLEIELIGWDIERSRGNVWNNIPETIFFSRKYGSIGIEKGINLFYLVSNDNISTISIIIFERYNGSCNTITIMSDIVGSIQHYVMPDNKNSSFSLSCWPNRIRYIKGIIAILLDKKCKIRVHISKSSIINISRQNSQVLANCIDNISMLRSSKYISNILIWNIKYTRTSNISNNSNFSNKIYAQSSGSDSWLGDARNRTNLRKEWYPAESTIPAKTLNKGRVRIIVCSGICCANKGPRKNYPSGILTPDTSMHRTNLIWILKNVIWTNNLGTTTGITMIKCCPSNISEPEISWQETTLINSCWISTIRRSNIKCHLSWMSPSPRNIWNKRPMNMIQSPSSKRPYNGDKHKKNEGD